jgi:AcrR family transcriptional regulator
MSEFIRKRHLEFPNRHYIPNCPLSKRILRISLVHSLAGIQSSRERHAERRREVDAAYELFYKVGFARAGVDRIAEAAKVTKRTLYYHFDSKDTLLGAVLDAQSELAMQRIERWAKGARGDPGRVVEVVFAEFEAWAKQPGWLGSGFTRAAMELADLPGHPARAAARRHKAAVESWLADQFAQNGIGSSSEVARQVILLIEGCHSLLLIHGDTSYARSASVAARLLVEQHRLRKSSGPRAGLAASV